MKQLTRYIYEAIFMIEIVVLGMMIPIATLFRG